MIKHTHLTVEDYIGGVIFSSFYIFAQYALPIMSYGLVILVAYCFYYFLSKGRLIINKYLFFMCTVAAIQQLIVYIITGTLLEKINTYIFLCLCIFMLATVSQISENAFFKCYYIVGIISSYFIFYQAFELYILHHSVSSIKILPISEEDMHYWRGDIFRVSGLFTEPQAFASFIQPILIMSLFRKERLRAILFTIAILLSGSSQGIIVGAIIWTYYIFVVEQNSLKKFICVLIGIIVIAIGFSSGIFFYAFNKITNINIVGYDVRLTKGFMIFLEMPLIDKITGIGQENLKQYLLSGNFHFFWMTLTREEIFAYVTTMSNILISYGIPVFLAYIHIFRKEMNCKVSAKKLLLIVILVISFSQTIFFNAWFIFYWGVYQILDDKSEKNYLRIKIKGWS